MYVTSRKNQANETKISDKMSSTDSNTDIEKTEDLLPVLKLEDSLSNSISKKFPNVEIVYVKPDRIRVNVKKEEIIEVASFIRDELQFDHAESVSGVDYPEDKQIEVVYHLGSYTDPLLSKQILALVTRAPREDIPHPGNDSTKLPSLRDVFPSVSFHERECFEMLGVYFDGHPDNRRLLLPEDWADIPPLRKDFAIKGR
jgi:NADH-quinone oxidoreductase subunit C